MAERERPVAVVTGAGAGIGRAVSIALADAGASVAVADFNTDAAAGTAQEIGARGGTSLVVSTDVSVEDQVVRLADEAESKLGPISTWVNIAGITRPAMLLKMEVEDFDAVISVHVRGSFLGTREAARRMTARNQQGVILNVTSSAGLQGTIGQVNYAAAKGAITALTKSAAKELARYGIRVNAVAPVAATDMTRTIRTDPKFAERFMAQIPLGRVAEPDEVAQLFAFLAAPEAAYITGQVVCIDGGLYMAS